MATFPAEIESPAATTHPVGVSPPLAVNTQDDRSGFIIVIAASFLGFALVSFGIRMYIQWSRKNTKPDDVLLLAAVVFSCIQSTSVFMQVNYGWGKAGKLILPQDTQPMLKATYVGDLLYIITLFLSKCSGALFYVRISPNRIHFRIVWAIVVLSIVWAIFSLLLLGLRCDTAHPWTDFTTKCSSLLLRWGFIAAIDIIIELCIASVSILLVHGIQSPLRRKAIIVSAFSARLLAAAPAIVHLYFLERQFNSQDPTLQGSFVTVCAQIQLGYSVISNSIPCLKPFMAAYESEGQKLSYRGQSSNESNNYHHENHDQSGHSKSCRDGCIHTLPMTPISSLALDSESPNHIASSKRKRQSKGKEPVSSIGPMEERGRNDSMISGG